MKSKINETGFHADCKGMVVWRCDAGLQSDCPPGGCPFLQVSQMMMAAS